MLSESKNKYGFVFLKLTGFRDSLTQVLSTFESNACPGYLLNGNNIIKIKRNICMRFTGNRDSKI